jgi:hypothetical protein
MCRSFSDETIIESFKEKYGFVSCNFDKNIDIILSSTA